VTFLGLLALASFGMTLGLLGASERVRQTSRIVSQADRVRSLVTRMETGLRGYLETGGGPFLDSYTEAGGSLDAALRQLGRLVASRPNQAHPYAALRVRAARWSRRAAELAALKQRGRAAVTERTLRSELPTLASALHRDLDSLIAAQRLLRDERNDSALKATRWGLLAAGLTALIVGGGLATTTRRRFAAVCRAYEQALATARERTEELRVSEARFQAFMEHSPAAAFIKDEQGRYVYGNRAWTGLFERPLDALLGQDDLALRGPERAQVLAESDRHVLESGALVEVPGVFAVPNQASRQWITLKFPLEYDSGRRLVGGIMLDVTELHRTEAELRSSEERYALALRGSSAGLWDWNCRTDDIYLSPRFKELVGYEDHEIENTLDRFVSLLHPEDSDRVLAAMSEHLAGRAPYDVEHRLLARSGEYRWFHAHGQAIWNDKGMATRMSGSISDITDRKKAEEEIRGLNAHLERRVRRLAALRRLDSAITAGLDLKTTLALVVDEVQAQLHADAADILLLDPRSQVLETAAEIGFRTDRAGEAAVPLARHGSGRVALERRSLFVPNVCESDDLVDRRDLCVREGFVAYYGIPVVAKGQVKGMLEVFQRTPLELEGEWVDFLEILAGQAAIAVDNLTLYEGMRRANVELMMAYDATIEGWSRALDLRDKETEGHSQRVTEMTLRLARAMGVGEADLVHIRRGALLHDIGKMGIPDRILMKPGPLNEEEWQHMRRHPDYAREMLSPIEFLRPSLGIPYCHHERFDGSGYPQGLVGEAIPLSARIFAVADIWDALGNDRPYRKAWPPGRIREYIGSLAGTALDPEVVATFLRLEAGSAAFYRESWVSASAARRGAAPSEPASTAPVHPALAPPPRRQSSIALEPPARHRLNVVVAESDPSALNQLRLLLESHDCEVIGAGDGPSALTAIRRGGIQVVIAASDLPGLDGPTLCLASRASAGVTDDAGPAPYFILAGRQGSESPTDGWPEGVDDVVARPFDAREIAARLLVARRLLGAQEQLLERSIQAERIYAELRYQNERLAELVATDPLTGLSNRRHFLEALEAQATLAERQGRPLSVLLLDVDRFKQYNDSYGHRAGDDVLCLVADILRSNVRGCDLVARYGGEEFVVVMPMTAPGDAVTVADRLRKAIADHAWPLRNITASFGVATGSPHAIETARLVDAADRALYHSKQSGRNRVTHFHEMSQSPAPVALLTT
jgi:diguanylate cyclase (GGDEF)-like protein/PAS domain S-box-containing protein/putative nucleotidyltransferase with HDIG domain